jgi:hypothetical protein
VIVTKTEISNKPCHWEDDTIKTNRPLVDIDTSTGGLLFLIVSSSQWHGLLDISVFRHSDSNKNRDI